jgi:hypothetical protein
MSGFMREGRFYSGAAAEGDSLLALAARADRFQSPFPKP